MQQSLTKQKSVIEAGTPGFQAPEQLMSQIVDVKADVYAFGCVLIELFGGIQIWKGLTQYQIIYQVTVKGEVPNSDHLPNEIGKISSVCLKKHDERPSSAEILLLLLSNI